MTDQTTAAIPVGGSSFSLTSEIRFRWECFLLGVVRWCLRRLTRGSNLVAHAQREIHLAGINEPDADYGGAIALEVLDLVMLFASQEHSGGSAWAARNLFALLSDFKTLGPNDHSSHRDVSEACGKPHGTVLQDSRDSRWFSSDGGLTWYNVEEPGFPGLPSA